MPCMNPNFTKDDIGQILPLVTRTPGYNPPYRDTSYRGGTASRLARCEGDCDGTTSQCLPGLKCFQRNGYTAVPGCSGSGARDYDYCIKA